MLVVVNHILAMMNTARPYVVFLLLQALYNVSSTSTRSSDEVLDELKRVLQDRDIMYKEKGYVSLHAIIPEQTDAKILLKGTVMDFQGCTLEAPRSHRRLTFAFGRLENLTFFHISSI